jgi:hypothetical protein
MSSSFRQGCLLYQVQCRVQLDRAVRCTVSNVEVNSTGLSAVPGPMSSSIRQGCPLYHIQCRGKFDRAVCCTRSNVELNSTGLSVVPGSVSSSIRQGCPLYEVKCRAQIDTIFDSVLCSFSLRCCYLVAAFEL